MTSRSPPSTAAGPARSRAARDAVRDAAIALSGDPEDAVRPAEPSALGRAGHGAATAVGTMGEAFDGSPLGRAARKLSGR